MPTDQADNDNVKVRLTREWLRKSREDLSTCERVLESPRLDDVAAYHAQQVAEKALKGFLFWHDVRFRKTHNLVELLGKCREIDPTFPDFTDPARLMTTYALQSRYPDLQAEADPEAVDSFVRIAAEVLEEVLNRLPESVHPGFN